MNSSWCDLADLTRHPLAARTWIVLRQLERIREVGQYAEPGWQDEFYGVASAMFPVSAARKVTKLRYNDLNSTWPHKPYVQDGRFMSAGVILPERAMPSGRYLVLEQSFEGSPAAENWHLDQDLLLGLGLMRRDDEWIAPAEDGAVVSRLRRGTDGRPNRLEILAEYLRDFLTARNSGIVIASYMSRAAVLDELPTLSWQSGDRRDVAHGHWEGFMRAVHPSGLPYGERVAVTRVFRTDAADAGDAPVFDMFDKAVSSEHYERGHDGGPFFHIEGSLHRTEWFGPANISLRVRGDREPVSDIAYRVGTDGSTATVEELLKPPIRYLYFRPHVIRDLLGRPSSLLRWFTEQTGEVGYRGHAVPFGVATNGLVNVVASDIAELPAAIQKVWMAQNVTPNGPVSAELLAAQMATKPAPTLAPESVFYAVLMQLDAVWSAAFGNRLVRLLDGAQTAAETACHRFQALSDDELPRLAKDLSRHVIERFDERHLKGIAPVSDEAGPERRRSLSLLTDILKAGHLSTAPVSALRAVNELRQDDSHLPASDRKRAYLQLGLVDDLPYPHKSKQLIMATVVALDDLTAEVARVLPAPPPSEG